MIFSGARLSNGAGGAAISRRVVMISGRFKIDSGAAQMRKVRVVGGTPADVRGRQFFLSMAGRVPGRLVPRGLLRSRTRARENVRLVVPKSKDAERRSAAEVKPEPLEQRLKRLTRDARLAGMRLLVALQGKSSKSLSELGERLQGETDDMPKYSRLLSPRGHGRGASI